MKEWNTEPEADVSREDVGRGRNVWLCLAADSSQKKNNTHRIPGDIYILEDESH